ncbi:divergent polysaccharide deacetylase family protein [Pedomonas mirosovicensis]|uniref:divergent polysaccharide deacetylase family protein n=1 Tax=Pedomonas mirosovicensis TaxID=2908641 RepID=UPI00216A4B6A|nr:divergent polysaccharide deacetylase family protein [Pedomonas mirosovicensis]MCH8685386.1 divergent polysaccharide deacetylase family protein [Pedomonas mirosovicensis]
MAAISSILRTTARSTARAIAARISLPYAERDVFLDNDITAAAIERQLAETESLARRYGSAIAIGHPHAQTLKVLEAWLPKAREKGFDLVPVSAIIATRGSPLWRLARDRKGSARS